MDEREGDKKTDGFCTDTFERFSSFFVNGIDGLLEAPQEKVLLSVGFPIRDLKFYVIVCKSSHNMLYVIVWVPSLSHNGKK